MNGILMAFFMKIIKLKFASLNHRSDSDVVNYYLLRVNKMNVNERQTTALVKLYFIHFTLKIHIYI